MTSINQGVTMEYSGQPWKRGHYVQSCSSTTTSLPYSSADRLTSLPDELLTRILSMLPTKDAAATQVLSKRMPRAFRWITSVDLDDSLISHCIIRPRLVERSSLFESFIDNVLHKLSHSQHPLTRFRLRLGGDKSTWWTGHRCIPACFPNPEPARLYAWISYPLAHCGLRELDLSFHVPNPAECKLSPGLFSHQSLEVLTLDSNLEINNSIEIPPISLPNLKILNLHSFVFNVDDYVTRLVSNCPALEDLSVTFCRWEKGDHLIIYSHSLQRLSINIFRKKKEEKCCDLVFIDTPNLQYFDYVDNIAFNYIVHLNAPVKAFIMLDRPDVYNDFESPFWNQLRLLRALSNVTHLSLHGWSIQGFFDDCADPCQLHKPYDSEGAALEAASWAVTQTIPSCCESRLKRIRIYSCFGHDQELNMMRFLLGKASVLKEFVISMNKYPEGILFDAPKLDLFKITLGQIPRASNSCSIIFSTDDDGERYCD